MHKKVILLVDNRLEEEPLPEPTHNVFKGSAFKATEIDAHDHHELAMETYEDSFLLNLLQEKISVLESRVSNLERSNSTGKAQTRIRRRAREIARDYQCPHAQCGKYYGSETSLKNHIKLKHPSRC